MRDSRAVLDFQLVVVESGAGVDHVGTDQLFFLSRVRAAPRSILDFVTVGSDDQASSNLFQECEVESAMSFTFHSL